MKLANPLLAIRQQYRLVRRRGGIVQHLQLRRTFKQIGNDPYVKQSRQQYAEQPTKYGDKYR
jgi:hypothetical protein